MSDRRFTALPEPVRLEDTITSEDVTHDEPVVDVVADSWLLKNAAG